MTNTFKSMSAGKKVLLGVGSFLLLSAAVTAVSPDGSNREIDKSKNVSNVKSEQLVTKTIEEVVAIPYVVATQDDASMPEGQTSITPGSPGSKVVAYEVTYTNGSETTRRQISEQVTKQPVNEVTKRGIKATPTAVPVQSCSPHYSGCVPIASDVDCAGGSGNGPAYADGPISVLGSDVYDLDRDGNGIACE